MTKNNILFSLYSLCCYVALGLLVGRYINLSIVALTLAIVLALWGLACVNE